MIKAQISVSLDGFVAGPDQSEEQPLGAGGESLHDWVLATEAWRRQHGRPGGERNTDSAIVETVTADVGAYVMGRKMFDGGEGEMDPSWQGWWGEDPPFHRPVFVVTHHPRESLEMKGGTSFHFVTEGIDAALDRASDAADGGDVSIAGGGTVIDQAIRAGRLDELWLHLVPILLGGGSRLFDGLAGIETEQVEVIPTDAVTHARYRFPR